MSSLNRAILIGRTGRDTEVRQTQNGSRVAILSLATSERWRDKATGENKEQTEWHRVVVWNDRAVEFCEKHVRKGSLICVEGQIKSRKFTDKDGLERTVTEIVVPAFGGSVSMLSWPPDDQPDQRGQQQNDRREAAPGRAAPADATMAAPRTQGWDAGAGRASNGGVRGRGLDDDIPF
jgi:single-strand DNA-binding protein